MMPMRSLYRHFSGKGQHQRLSILIFHRVLERPDSLFADEMHSSRFNEICGWLKTWFNVLPLDAAVAHLRSGNLPERAACITFDDGYADNFQVAMPILQQNGLSACFFIATGFLNGGCMWNDTVMESVRLCRLPTLDLTELGLGQHVLATLVDRRRAIDLLVSQLKYRPLVERQVLTEQLARLARVLSPTHLMMTSAQVKSMRQAGMQVGAHTVSHPILARMQAQDVRQEVMASRDYLEQLLGERIGLFAYPNGKPDEDYLPATADIVRGLGFDAAVSTQWGASCCADDLFQLRRFTPWDKSRLRFGLRLLQNLRSA